MRITSAAAAVGMCVALVAACGSDNSSSSSASSAAPTTVATSASGGGAATTTASGGTATTSAASAGASPVAFSDVKTTRTADRKGQTIKIGLTNAEGGPLSEPEYRIAAETAIAEINENGGVNGATIDLLVCLNTTASPEGTVDCANQFVSAGAVLVTNGIDYTSAAAVPVMGAAGIPYIANAVFADQQKDPNSFAIGSALAGYAVTTPAAMKDLGVERIGFVILESPPGREFVGLMEEAAEKLGIEVTSVFVDPTAPDFGVAVQNLLSTNPDAMWGFVAEPQTIQWVQAAKQQGFDGLIHVGSTANWIKEFGDDGLGIYNTLEVFYPDMTAYAPPRVQENLKAYVTAMTDAGHADLAPGLGTESYGRMMNIRTVLESIPAGTEITAQSAKQAFENAKGVPGYFSPDFDCTTTPFPALPSVCRASLVVTKLVKDGSGALVRQPISDKDYGFRDDSALANA